MEALNLDNVICINLKSVNNEQLFAICEEYGLDFSIQVECKNNNILKEWILLDDVRTGLIQETIDCIHWNSSLNFKDLGVQIDIIRKIKPIKTPKIKKTPETLRKYKLFVEQGCDLYIPSLDQKLGLGKTYELVSESKVELNQISKSKLEILMQEAVSEENYELAASLRDQINSCKL